MFDTTRQQSGEYQELPKEAERRLQDVAGAVNYMLRNPEVRAALDEQKQIQLSIKYDNEVRRTAEVSGVDLDNIAQQQATEALSRLNTETLDTEKIRQFINQIPRSN